MFSSGRMPRVRTSSSHWAAPEKYSWFPVTKYVPRRDSNPASGAAAGPRFFTLPSTRSPTTAIMSGWVELIVSTTVWAKFRPSTGPRWMSLTTAIRKPCAERGSLASGTVSRFTRGPRSTPYVPQPVVPSATAAAVPPATRETKTRRERAEAASAEACGASAEEESSAPADGSAGAGAADAGVSSVPAEDSTGGDDTGTSASPASTASRVARRARRPAHTRTGSVASVASSRYSASAIHRNPGQARARWSQKGAPERSATRAAIISTGATTKSTVPARRAIPRGRVVSRIRRDQTYRCRPATTASTARATSAKTMTTRRVPYDVRRSARSPRNPMTPTTVPSTKDTTASVRCTQK